MKTTITKARANLRALWDMIERTKRPVIIQRRGHEDMAVLPAAELERMQIAATAPCLARLDPDVDEQPERQQGVLADLVTGMKQVTAGVPVDCDAELAGAVTHLLTALTAEFSAELERMQDPAAWAATRRGLQVPPANVELALAAITARAVRHARILALARHVWHDNANDVAAFLSTPQALLGGRTPNECSVTERETAMVEVVLLRLAFGVAR